MFRRIAFGCVSAAVLALVWFPGAAWADLTTTEGQLFSGRVVAIGCSLGMAEIDWGDRTPTSTGGPTQDGSGVQGSHTYLDEGTYNGSVTYTCSGGRVPQTATFQATVQDAPLAAAGRDISGTAGQSLTAVVAHIDDANPVGDAGNFSAQIAWGDGSTTAGSVVAAAGGGFDLTGTHTYIAAGNYPVFSLITDIGGSTATASSIAQIAPAAAQPPRNTDAPIVSGVAHETDTLTTTTGFWSGSPSDFQYQWLRCATPTGSNCVVVPGATASTYTAVHADVGSTMRSRVRAHNGVGTSLPADSLPTAVVKPLTVTARFMISPNPTCTGLPVTFDATTSITPNPPIERYRFTESVPNFFPNIFTTPADWVVADGANPRASEIPTYNYHLTDSHFIGFHFDAWVAETRYVTLTVTDRAGRSDSVTQRFSFDPAFSDQSRAHCPGSHRRIKPGHFSVHSLGFKATKTSLTTRIPCATVADCAGSLRLVLLPSRSHRGAKPVVIASATSFYATGHHAATITAKLTRAGRSLLSQGKPVAAIAQLTSVTLTGGTTTQSLAVTLIGIGRRP